MRLVKKRTEVGKGVYNTFLVQGSVSKVSPDHRRWTLGAGHAVPDTEGISFPPSIPARVEDHGGRGRGEGLRWVLPGRTECRLKVSGGLVTPEPGLRRERPVWGWSGYTRTLSSRPNVDTEGSEPPGSVAGRTPLLSSGVEEVSRTVGAPCRRWWGFRTREIKTSFASTRVLPPYLILRQSPPGSSRRELRRSLRPLPGSSPESKRSTFSPL